MHPYYEDLGYNISDFPASKDYYDQALSLPLYYTLTRQEQEKVIYTLKELLQR